MEANFKLTQGHINEISLKTEAMNREIENQIEETRRKVEARICDQIKH
jgi:hypothetical protein